MDTKYVNPANLVHYQQQAKPCVVALGFFDGLHYGHREVLETAKRISREKNLSFAVMSFFPHPKEVLSNGKEKVDYLMPISEKKKLLKEFGVDTFYVVEFTKEFAGLSAKQFVTAYLTKLGVVHAVAGFDFTYGKKGTGNMNRLKSDSYGKIEVTTVTKIENRGEKVSSTLIREILAKGKVENLPDYLGRFYETECECTEALIKPRLYYTLPAPGYYSVIIKSGKKRIPAEIKVFDENRITIERDSTIYQALQNNISIVWQQKMVGVLT